MRPFLLATLCLLLASCSGTPSRHIAAPAWSQTTNATFIIHVPPASQSAKRLPAYVSPSTQSVTVAVNGSTPASFNAVGPTISVSLAVPLGSDTFVITAYSAPNGGGNTLASLTTVLTVAPNATLNVVLGGIAAGTTLSVANTTPQLSATAQAIGVTLTLKDAGNNTINGAYATPVSLTSSDPNFAFSPSSVSNSSTPITLVYSGGCSGPVTLTASGGASANVVIGLNRHQITSFADAGPGTLRQLLLGASSGDIDYASTNGAITLASSLPAPGTNYSVCATSGNTLTIDGVGSYSGFQVAASLTAAFANLAMNHMSIAVAGGAAIDVLPGATATIRNVDFMAGSSSAGSGALRSQGTTTLTGGTFGNNTNGGGNAALAVNAGTTSITGTTFTNNSSTNFSPIGVSSGSLSCTNCTFTSNSQTSGSFGGVLSTNGSAVGVTLTSCAFNSNTTNGGGGAINIQAGTLTVANSSFSSNSENGGFGGGAISFSGTTGTINNSTFQSNFANAGGFGGAISVQGGTLAVRNSTVTGNGATFGGGIGANGGTINLSFSTVVNNAVGTGSGGNIKNGGVPANFALLANIIQGGTAASGVDVFGSFNDSGYDVIGNPAGAGGLSGTDSSGAVALGSLTGSPAYYPITTSVAAYNIVPVGVCNTGTGPFGPTTFDQLGTSRPHLGANCSAGSFEP